MNQSIYFVLVSVVYCILGCKSQEMMSNPNRGERFKTGTFASIQGIAAKKILKTTQVIDKFDCVDDCTQHPSCYSFNFQTSGNPKHLCELSDIFNMSGSMCYESRPGYLHYYPSQVNPPAAGKTLSCKNGGSYHNCSACKCQAFNTGEECEDWTIDVSSCKDILTKTSYRRNMAYTFAIDNKPTDIYCHLTDDICGGGGWTLAMKINGLTTRFSYTSVLWSNKEAFEMEAGKTGFDDLETKMPSYWAMSFQKLCVGFKVNNVLKWAVIPYPASSLYDVIADGSTRFFGNASISKATWMSLIDQSSMQNNCNREGFNTFGMERIGFISNNENHCDNCDSFIGFGLKYGPSCGNKCGVLCSNNDRTIIAVGYIMIQ